MQEEHVPWLTLAICVTLIAVSIAVAIALTGYLTLPSKPRSLTIAIIIPPNSSLVPELTSIEISDTAPSVLISIRSTNTAPHSGRIEVVAYHVGCGEDVIAYGETGIEVSPNRTATAIVQLKLRQGYSVRDINSIEVILKIV